MTREEASDILELSTHASPGERAAQYETLRRQLEDKLAKAPTPGLREKYRTNLKQLEDAFAALAQAEDSSALPVTRKQQAGSKEQGGANPSAAGSPPAATLPASSKPKSGGKEFLAVTVIAIAVLGAGGWWVMKTKSENEEKARIAAELKAEADRQAAAEKAEQERKTEEKRLAEESRRRAEEAEKARLAAEAKAEQERLERLTGQLRGELATFKVRWEALEKEERNAERRLSELKSDLRSLRDPAAGVLAEVQALAAAQQNFYDWLSGTLARHPARVAHSKSEELVAARQPDAAAAVMDELRAAFAELETLIPQKRAELASIRGRLRLVTADTASWTITDAFGQTRSGEGGGEISGLAVGRARLRLRKELWPDREASVTIRNDKVTEFLSPYETQGVDVASTPAGAAVFGPDGKAIGRTPLRVELPPGKWTVTLKLDGYVDQKIELPRAAELAMQPVALHVKPKGLVKPERWVSPERLTVESRQTMSGALSMNSHVVEEWDLSQRDARMGWTQVVRKFVIFNGSNAEHAPVAGSVLRQQRQADGKWSGNFLQGGLRDPSFNHIWGAIKPALWVFDIGLLDWWPADVIPEGGTWPVKPEIFFTDLGLANASGQVVAKLLALDRQAEQDRAIIEFSYTYNLAGMTSKASLKMHLNLTECYVSRIEGADHLTYSAGVTNSSYTTTVTKRR